MKDEILLTVTCIVDADTPIYHVGEIDFGIVWSKLDEYLKDYGRKGKFEVVDTLAYLICEVERKFNELQSKGEIKEKELEGNKK